MGIYQTNKKIKKILRIVKMLKAKMLFNKCNNNLLSKGEKTFLRERDFWTIKPTILWIFKIKLTLHKTIKTLRGIQVDQDLLLKKMLIYQTFKIFLIKN